MILRIHSLGTLADKYVKQNTSQTSVAAYPIANADKANLKINKESTLESTISAASVSEQPH